MAGRAATCEEADLKAVWKRLKAENNAKHRIKLQETEEATLALQAELERERERHCALLHDQAALAGSILYQEGMAQVLREQQQRWQQQLHVGSSGQRSAGEPSRSQDGGGDAASPSDGAARQQPGLDSSPVNSHVCSWIPAATPEIDQLQKQLAQLVLQQADSDASRCGDGSSDGTPAPDTVPSTTSSSSSSSSFRSASVMVGTMVSRFKESLGIWGSDLFQSLRLPIVMRLIPQSAIVERSINYHCMVAESWRTWLACPSARPQIEHAIEMSLQLRLNWARLLSKHRPNVLWEILRQQMCLPAPPGTLPHAPGKPPLHPVMLQAALFMESHLDAAQLAELRELWRDYKQKVYSSRQRYGGAALQMSFTAGTQSLNWNLNGFQAQGSAKALGAMLEGSEAMSECMVAELQAWSELHLPMLLTLQTPHAMELLVLTSPLMPDASIMCHWLFGDEVENGGHPEPRDGRGAVTATPWTLIGDSDVGGSGGDDENAILPPLSVLLDDENLLA